MTTNNISRRLLAMVMVICMVATMFAGITFTSAEVGTAATSVVIGGVTLNSETPYLLETTETGNFGIKASASTSEDGYTLHATFENGTLTFNRGFDLAATDATWIEAGPNWNSMIAPVLDTTDNVYYGIKANGDLTIDTGSYNNFIHYDWTSNVKDRNNWGVFVDGDLTIEGDGLLQITSNPAFDVDDDNDPYTSYGIKATGDVNLNGGTVYVYESLHSTTVGTDETTTFISAGGGDINLGGAVLKFRASGLVDERITLLDGTLNYDESAYLMNEYPQYVTSKGDQANGARGFVRSYPTWAGAGSANSITYAPAATLTFDVDGGDAIEALTVEKGTTVDLSAYVPTKGDYEFRGWYTEAEFINVVSSVTVTENTTIYAKLVAPAGPATSIWFAGATLNADTPYAMQIMKNEREANGGVIASATGEVTDATAEKLIAYFDASTGTLQYRRRYAYRSLDGTVEPELAYNTYTTMQLYPDTNTKYGIKAEGDLIIDLNGYINGLWLDWNSNIMDVNTRGIDVDGNLTITDGVGGGYFRITASAPQDVNADYEGSYTAYGVKATGDVNFEGGKVYFFERPYVNPVDGDTATFVYADGSINIDGGEIKMRGQKISTWLTKFNKTPNYDEEMYVYSDSSNIEIRDTTDQTLGYTRYPDVEYYGNTNNATYSLAAYLTFNVDGGSAVESLKVAKGTTVDLLQYTPTKAGYDFIGWYEDEALTKAISSVTLSADTTVYAKWEETFVPVGVATEIIVGGVTLNASTPYLLELETNSQDVAVIASAETSATVDGANYVLHATFAPATGTLTFNRGFSMAANNGMVEPNFAWNSFIKMAAPAGESTKYGIKANGDLTIDLNGYNNALWTGWSSDIENDNVMGIYALGNVTIQGNGFLRIAAHASKNNTANSNAIYAKGDINLNGGTVYAYEGNYSTYLPVNGSKSVFLNANGDINLNGGTLRIRTQKNVTYTEKYNKTPIYNAENYDVSNDAHLFINGGGNTNAGHGDVFSDASYNGTTNISYTYAPKVTLTFVTNEGTAIEAVKVVKGSTVSLSTYVTTKEGSIFKGWHTDAELTNKVSTITPDADTTVYAKWGEVAGDATEVIYGGVTLDATNKYLVLTNAGDNTNLALSASETTPEDATRLLATFDAETSTLTYNRGYGLTMHSNAYEPDFNWNAHAEVALIGDAYYGIKANGNITIDLNGFNNWFRVTAAQIYKNDLYGIYSDGDITIVGDGYLKIPATLAQNMNASGDNAPHNSYGIYSDTGSVNLNGGTVKVYATHAARWDLGTNVNSTAVYAYGDINLGGTILQTRYQTLLAGQAGEIKTFSKTPVGLEDYITTALPETNTYGSGAENLAYTIIETGGTNPYNFTYAPSYTVAFEVNGGTAVDALTVAKGTSIDLGDYTTTKDEVLFGGWYTDAELTDRVTSIVVNANTTLYAKWRVPAGPATEIIMGGVTLDATNKYLVLLNANDSSNLNPSAASDLPSDETRLLATFDAATGTLTYNRGYALATGENEFSNGEVVKWHESAEPYFNNFNPMLYTALLEGTTTHYGIKANGNLIVDLNGFNNGLYTHMSTPYENNNSIGIFAEGDVTITDTADGSGFLAITATPSKNNTKNSHAIMAEGNINFEAGTVLGYNGTYNEPVNGAETVFYYADGSINLVGGAVKVRTTNWKLYDHFNVEPNYDAEKYEVQALPKLGVTDLYFGTRARATTKIIDSFNTNSANYLPKYTLSFDADGINSVTKLYGETVEIYSSEYVPTMEGYDFSGWYTDAEYTTEAETPFAVCKDTTLYAKWTVPAAHATEIFFAGLTLNEENRYVIEEIVMTVDEETGNKDYTVSLRAASVVELNENETLLATFDAATGTLTYNSGYDFMKFPANYIHDDGVDQQNPESAEYATFWRTYANMAVNEVSGAKSGIYADGSLTIDLGGFNNGFWTDWNKDIMDVNIRGIEVKGNLTIKGDGYLRIAANPPVDAVAQEGGDGYDNPDVYDAYGIKVDGNLNLEGGMVYIFARPYNAPDSGSTFISAGGVINLNGGSVKMRARKSETWLTKFNKTPIYDADAYVVSGDENLELASGTIVGETLGFTVDKGAGYGNNNNVSYRAKRTVTFDVDGGTPVDAIATTENSEIDLSAITTEKDGMVFKGWATDAEGENFIDGDYVVTGNATLYVVWKSDVTLTFNVGEGAEAIDPVTELEGTEIDLATYVPEKAGYTFDGWYLEDTYENAVETIVIDADTTIYAKWSKNFTITFNVDGGSAIDPVSVANGTVVDLGQYVPVRAGYTFGGWYYDPDFIIEANEVTVDGDLEFYAYWIESDEPVTTYTLTFNVNGGSAIDAVTAAEGTVVDLATKTTTKAGYTFGGWFSDAGLTAAVTSVTLNADTIVYAKWNVELTGNEPVFTIKADKATVAPGGTVTYSLYFKQNEGFAAFAMNFVLPAGLTYVADSFAVDSAAVTLLGSNPTFTPAMNMLFSWYSATSQNVTYTNEFKIAEFQATVADGATLGDTFEVTLANVELAKGIEDISSTVVVVPATVTVGEEVASEGVTVSGTAISYINSKKPGSTPAEDAMLIELIATGATEASYSTTVYVNNKNGIAYSIEGVAAGTYTMKVSKTNHVTREYTVTVADTAVTQDVKIHGKGDINGDGSIRSNEVGNAYKEAGGSGSLEGYEFDVADLNGDGRIRSNEVGNMYKHTSGSVLLW